MEWYWRVENCDVSPQEGETNQHLPPGWLSRIMWKMLINPNQFQFAGRFCRGFVLHVHTAPLAYCNGGVWGMRLDIRRSETWSSGTMLSYRPYSQSCVMETFKWNPRKDSRLRICWSKSRPHFPSQALAQGVRTQILTDLIRLRSGGFMLRLK